MDANKHYQYWRPYVVISLYAITVKPLFVSPPGAAVYPVLINPMHPF